MTVATPKVLLVDDVEANLVALEGILGRMPCALVRASSGNEALRLLLKHDFAVILLDVQMPEMDGYEVAQHARDNPATRNVPIIFVTATHETKESVLRGYDTGAFDLLFKPIDPYVLRSKVQVFLELHLNRLRLRAEIEAHKQTLSEVEAFNYSVSHDLRAPLRPLEGFSQVLLEDYAEQLDTRAKDYLVRIRTAARRMGQLIDDLLELSRVSRVPLRRKQVDLSSLVTDILAQIRADHGDRRVDLVCPAGIAAEGDDRALRIALENLLRNAWKFTEKQSHATIEFGRTPDGVFFVADDGVGFDPTYAQRLFQPFQRLHGSEYPGSGIGLAIVHRIVRRHEGRIWAESAPSKGAKFFFTLYPSPTPSPP